MKKVEFDLLTVLYFNCHKAINEMIRRSTGKYPKRYKRFEKGRIDKLLNNIPYKSKSKIDFCAGLMSRLIVVHGLPNTNHRTTIFFISIILHEMKIKFPGYDLDRNERKWIDECNEYIAKSKGILYRRQEDADYGEKHYRWTKEWLARVIGDQSKSSGIMSRHLFNSLKKISSSDDLSSVMVE